MKKWITALVLFSIAQTPIFADELEKTAHLSKGVNSLGQRLIRQLAENEPSKNIFISSYSIHEALSMALTGAREATRTELAKLLGLSGRVDNEELAREWETFRKSILNADPKVKFEIANSMWGNKGNKVRFLKEFTKLNRQAHDAEIRDDLDFQDEAFVSTLNGWVSEKTYGKIPTILSPPIPEDQLFYLVNAIYFKGVWAVEFDKKGTVDADFTRLNGKKSEIKLMNRAGNYAYYEDRQLQAVQLPFGTERRFTLAVYLPRAHAAKNFLANLRSEDLNGVQQEWGHRNGSVSIPRFKIEYDNAKMVDVLKSMGVKISFSDDANFDGIAENEAAKINVIIHKAVVEVNEEGAEAAAATIVGGITTTSVEPELPFKFRADRPFYFEIRDNKSGLVVFSGLMHDPK